jgi:uncharacterized protein (TIGR00290 family)
MMKALSSWSGGKDSCLALYKAIENGYDVRYLLNFISKEYQRCCFHGIEAGLIQLQSELIGIPLLQKQTTQDMKKYEDEFKEAVSGIKGISAMVFGDIYLDEHREWIERVCREIGIMPVLPLWGKPAEGLMEEFISLGFKAVVVSCQADKFDKDFVGRLVDKNLIEELKSRKICPAGENGEFHTFVIDGPIFKKRIQIFEGESLFKEGFWKYWFLDIKRYGVVEK